MSKKSLSINSWVGGQSSDDQEGQPNSFAYSKHMDFRKSPTRLQALPKTTKDSGSTVTDLVTAGIQLPSGKKVFIDLAGGVYTYSTSGVWAKLSGSLGATAHGMVYNSIHDTIYVPNARNISTITGADDLYGNSPTISADTFVASQDQSGGTTANTYTTTDTITETATHILSFTPAVDPLYSIKLSVATKGSGGVVVTLHDAANNTLATVTKTAASLTNGALNEWVFTTPVRVRASPNASTYHVHVTHPSGTATTIGTTTASNFSTANFSTWGSRLISPTNGFHPVVEFLNFYCIANGNYLTVWEPISQSAPSNTEWNRHRLTFPLGYEVTSMAIYSEYLAIACEKRSASTTNEFQDGKIFFWDGTSQGFNFVIDFPQGAPYSIFSDQNRLEWIGVGKLWAWSGDNPEPVQQISNTDTEYTAAATYTVNYPNMMTSRNGITLAGYPSETSNTAVEHAVYSFGKRNRLYPESFGYSYSSTATTNLNTGSNNLRIGMVKNFGDQLFISWREGSTYGVDKVQNTSAPFASGEMRALWFTNERRNKRKLALKLTVTFDALPTGCTVTPKYRITETTFTTGTAAVATETSIEMNINVDFNAIQLGFDWAATATTPVITDVTFTFDDLAHEED